MTNDDYRVALAMRAYGGGFVIALAGAIMVADDNNLYRIKAAFPEIWEQYTDMAERSGKHANSD